MILLQALAPANAANVPAIKGTITAINNGHTRASYFTRCGIFATNTANRLPIYRVSLTRFLPRLGSACAGLFFARSGAGCAGCVPLEHAPLLRVPPHTKSEFSFLNGNLAVPARRALYLWLVGDNPYREIRTRPPYRPTSSTAIATRSRAARATRRFLK